MVFQATLITANLLLEMREHVIECTVSIIPCALSLQYNTRVQMGRAIAPEANAFMRENDMCFRSTLEMLGDSVFDSDPSLFRQRFADIDLLA
jgi:hypothetical protein